MPTLSLSDSEIALISDLVEWLPTATQEELLEYTKNLPENFWEENVALKSELLLEIRIRRNRGLEEHCATNAPESLSEEELLSMVAAFAAYNPASVVANLSKKYPGIRFGTPTPDITSWARQAVALWQNYLSLVTGQLYLQRSLLLHSLLKSSLASGDFPVYAHQAENLVRLTAETVANEGFAKVLLPTESRRQIATFLRDLGFLPQEYIESLLTPRGLAQLLRLLDSLAYLLDFVVLMVEARAKAKTEEEMKKWLWDSLATDEERAIWVASQLEWEARHHSGSEEEKKWYAFLVPLLSVEFLVSGHAAQALTEQMSRMSSEQRRELSERVYGIITTSPEVEAAIVPIDPEYFASTWKRVRDEGETENIELFRPDIPDEQWARIRPALTTLGHILSLH